MKIRHRQGAYPIIFTSLEVARDAIPNDAYVVTDSNLAKIYVRHFRHDLPTLVVPAGEKSKSVPQYDRIVNWLARHQMLRSQPLVAFGGGMIGDLVGFAASTYMRGVPLIQIPTTLLSMVDSSVGGKVGVDLESGKNLIGAFKAPATVYICPEVLQSLPEREFRSGVAEILKYGFVMDEPLASSLARLPLLPGDGRLPDTIKTCIAHKAAIVERDEFDLTGQRAILNFGHTVGHAIEALQDYQGLLHGEAIAIGMVAEAQLSEDLGFAPPLTRAAIEDALVSHGLPTRIPEEIETLDLIRIMQTDKKATGTGLAFSLVGSIGTCKLQTGVTMDDALRSLNELRRD
ncbi:MAG: 3-dehydroquinate synthase [Chthonomonas sp.]|nr:3-dehydroquinate synthase [Chthonomonas sp.]